MNTLTIGKRIVGAGEPCLIIAEIGSNHNNDLDMVKGMIESASQSGVDVVKFQSFKADGLVVKKTFANGKYSLNPRWELLKGLELPEKWHKELLEFCCDRDVIFMSSPWDFASVDLLESLGVKAYKIGSSDITYYPLLRYIASTQKPIIMSVGMSTAEQINEAIEVIRSEGNEQIALLHCIVNYPPELETVNLNYIKKLKRTYAYPIGYSDHNVENIISLAAVGIGAQIIEKHITLSRDMPGPDHAHAITLKELGVLVKDIRSIEKALGVENYQPGENEFNRIKRARRGVYASVDIDKGEEITQDCIEWLRPGGTIEPKDIASLIGLHAKKRMKRYHNISWDDLV